MVVPLHPNYESQIALRKLRETQIVYYECITNYTLFFAFKILDIYAD